ncbi:hypothetical protein PRBRB14_22050 [Hallella multisaccharivorax DSM 17128]|uniref:Uncharacterized protein n=2 Tax=Hallella multisaccharivorax TaxID=310514 RepID=F8N7H4_9BACT|nr:hypothetical protein [Hallella multisaccharivorax]EGN57434.1 hypothetical protein Premu_2040 [Hallella multisaccharivorax DSM 17128]GJG31326.1 hypothetical protein PRBRB14_22050 [Hallella multisaccharivorax DSM 17128]
MARRQRRAFLMRWNPRISSYTQERFDKDFPSGEACDDWSIWDYQKSHSGDLYFMAKVGSKVNGIVWGGYLNGRPYQLQDIATDQILPGRFIKLTYQFIQDIDKQRAFTSDELSEVLPNIDWDHGHSGVQLSIEDSEKLALYLGNMMLHMKEDKYITYDSYEEKHYVICDMITYLCPQLKERLLKEGKIADGYKPAKEITDIGVNYIENAVKENTCLEDILFLTNINGELILLSDED